MTTDKSLSNLLETWYHALRTEHGLRLESPDRVFLSKQLYSARQQAFDEDLDVLAIVMDSRDDKVLWIVKKSDAQPDPQDVC